MLKNYNTKNLKDPKKTGQPQASRSSCQGQLISLDWLELNSSYSREITLGNMGQVITQ